MLDVMLPDVDGFEVCRRLRDDGIDTPVLLLTARDGRDEAVRGGTHDVLRDQPSCGVDAAVRSSHAGRICAVDQ